VAHYFVSILVSLLVLLTLFLTWVYVVWKWFSLQKAADHSVPTWRTVMAICALLSVSISTGLGIFLLVHAAFTGGYPFYHPIELFCIRVGFLTALLGLVAGPMARRKVRLPIAMLSAVNLLLWFMDATSQ
jgi:hypothetical protein